MWFFHINTPPGYTTGCFCIHIIADILSWFTTAAFPACHAATQAGTAGTQAGTAGPAGIVAEEQEDKLKEAYELGLKF